MKLENKPAALPELNLYNFEEEEFADSKYVLTSPRSLEACDMLNVKPLELIYKPLSDYQDEMRRRGLTFQHAYDEYDKFEKSRQRKLRECRDYRDKMIRDNIFKNSPDPAAEYDVMLPADDGLYDVEDSHRVTTSQSLFTTPYSSEGVFHTQPQPSSTWRASKANKVDDTHLQSNGREENGWRAHPPFSERHLSKHRHRTKSRHVDDLEPSHEVLASGLGNGQELRTNSNHVETTPGSVRQPFKSRFMLENYGQAFSGDSENRKEMTSSLPLHRDDPYQSAYKYHRRSYTTDGLVGGGSLNRTSTPYDNSVPTKTRAMDRSFTSISDIPLSSPREEPRVRRQRTSSAYTTLERETAALRNVTSAAAEDNMTRSLSLTDLVQPRERYRHRPSTRRPYCQNRGYLSDDDYYSPQHTDQMDEVLTRALERRQREIENDLRNEQLEYEQQVEDLRLSLQDTGLQANRHSRSLWRRSPRDYLGYSSHHSRHYSADHHVLSPRLAADRYLPQEYEYADETLADRTQRERRRELAREQAVRELESARVKSKKCRLHSERVRKAFREAVSMNESKWRATELANETENGDSYHHVQNVLTKSLGERLSHNRAKLSNGTEANGHHHTLDRDLSQQVGGGDERPSLQRNDSVLTEEAVRRHTLLSSLSSKDAEDFDNYLAEVQLNADVPQDSGLANREEYMDDVVNGSSPLVYGDLHPPTNRNKKQLTNGHQSPIFNGHTDRQVNGSDLNSDEYIRRPKKPSNNYHHRSKSKSDNVEDDRVKEMKLALERRRKELTDKLKATARQTQELRAARLESEKRERDRQQRRSSRRMLKDCENNKRKLKEKSSKEKGRLTEQVRTVKSMHAPASKTRSPHERDTFDKKVLKAELNNWVTTGQRSQRARSRSANRNQSQFTLA